MNSLKVIGKVLDQPKLVANFSNAMPAALTTAGALYTINQTIKAPKKDKKKTFIKNTSILAGTIGSALLATRGIRPVTIKGKTILKGFDGLSERMNLKEIKEEQTELIDRFIKENKELSKDCKNILEKSKNKILGFKDTKKLHESLEKCEKGNEFLKKFIPEPDYKTSKEIFSEISRLSVMGLVPVLGGILGGIAGDKITEKDWKDRIPNKVKEGAYQYLANIFLCNIGAGGALFAMEKANVKSKTTKAIAMIAGIIATGVIGGSAMANFIGRKLIDPMFDINKENGLKKPTKKDSRTPELLDVSLHIDDIATVGVMSGLRWIEPALPMLYSISGFRAGSGYRNSKEKTIEEA